MMGKKTKWFIIPCAALGLTLGSALVSYAATGWAEENGEWVYYQKDGSKAADVFAKSGSNWFYLDSDGTMAKSQLIEKDDNYYYVNSAGAMVTNGGKLKMRMLAVMSRIPTGITFNPTARP